MERTAHQLEVEETENFGRGQCSSYQKFVWDLMEKPESSTAAKIVSVISMSFVFVSIVGMVISTLPALQFKVRLSSLTLRILTVTSLLQAPDGTLMENPWLNMIETICIAWFTLEYFLRWGPGRTVRAVLTLNFQVCWSSSQVSVSHGWSQHH